MWVKNSYNDVSQATMFRYLKHNIFFIQENATASYALIYFWMFMSQFQLNDCPLLFI